MEKPFDKISQNPHAKTSKLTSIFEFNSRTLAMRKWIVVSIFLWFNALSLGIFAQSVSLSGIWLGKLIQDEVAPFSEYILRMELKQEGARVVGISYISMPEKSELFAKMRLEGRWANGVFSFHEIEMMDSHHTDGWGWCLKAGDLALKQVGQYQRLEGKWAGYMDDFPCKPGTLALEKLNQQAKKEPIVTKVVEPKIADANGDFGAVQGRTITHQKEILVKNGTFSIYVWDADKVDGDLVSLQYNGQWLLRKFPISKTKKALRIEIVEGGENQLILFAENEGQYPPNTAAISFFDGKQERNLNLSSNMNSCGALKFVMIK